MSAQQVMFETATDTDQVMALAVKVMRTTADLDVYTDRSVKAMCEAEVEFWAAVRGWMESRGISVALSSRVEVAEA